MLREGVQTPEERLPTTKGRMECYLLVVRGGLESFNCVVGKPEG